MFLKRKTLHLKIGLKLKINVSFISFISICNKRNERNDVSDSLGERRNDEKKTVLSRL